MPDQFPNFEQKVVMAVLSVLIVVVLPAGCMYGCPKYNIWEREQRGRAELAQAEWNRKIKVEEAKAKKLSAIEEAAAEVTRANGVAQANQIIGESLKNNESYLRYLWIQGLQDKDNNVIYVPTEAGLPVLEAGKRP
jgi:regulator of protease activity HflC (stomatin/prohibitin superfamily)